MVHPTDDVSVPYLHASHDSVESRLCQAYCRRSSTVPSIIISKDSYTRSDVHKGATIMYTSDCTHRTGFSPNTHRKTPLLLSSGKRSPNSTPQSLASITSPSWSQSIPICTVSTASKCFSHRSASAAAHEDGLKNVASIASSRAASVGALSRKPRRCTQSWIRLSFLLVTVDSKWWSQVHSAVE